VLDREIKYIYIFFFCDTLKGVKIMRNGGWRNVWS